MSISMFSLLIRSKKFVKIFNLKARLNEERLYGDDRKICISLRKLIEIENNKINLIEIDGQLE